MVRSGLVSPRAFWGSLARTIGTLESDPAREWVSVAQASTDTWIHPHNSFYYTKGELLGFLLDLTLRRHTENRVSLDEVMRILYRDYYEAGRGFTEEDLRVELERACGCGLIGFFTRYVSGVALLDYARYLDYAGLSLSDSLIIEPFIGVGLRSGPEGQVTVDHVVSGSSADRAGLQPGDVILRIGDFTPPDADWSRAFRAAFRDRLGEETVMVVRRGEEVLERPFEVGRRERREFSIRPVEGADGLALAIRRSIVAR